jgi:outer membrane receptor for ferrienterochelin and colicin
LDVVYSQRIGRQLNLKLAARNLLNPVIERTYGEDSEAIYSSFTRGRTYSISLNYDF